MPEQNRARVDWIQLGVLLLAMLALALRGEQRLSRIEQYLEDDKQNRAELLKRIDRLEQEWAHSPGFPPSSKTPQ